MATSLAVKYRPKTFDEIVEQSVVTDLIKAVCNQEVLPFRNFLFTGPAGTGKTTLARAIANYINHGQGEPIELDAASHGNIENIRQLIEQAQSYPVGCEYKVFIIDECHAFSNTGWQSWLKCIEEPPAKSVFLFATTNPEKIPATILSRVQSFQLSKISLSGIGSRLKYVIEQEKSEGRDIKYTEDAINFIAKLANGGMRDALTLLDKALAYSSDVNSKSISEALNLPNYDDYFSLLGAYAKKDNLNIAAIIHYVYNSGVNFITWMEGFHSFVMNVVKYIFLQKIEATMIPSHYEDKISKYGVAHSTICLKLANKLLLLLAELKQTQYQQEVALTYLCSVEGKK